MNQNANQEKTPKTLKDHLKNFGGALFIVGTTLLLLELMLRIFDPWGLVYFDDMVVMGNSFVYDEQRLIALPEGDYQFTHWAATVRDSVRLTPATNTDADCNIVLIGDSVTFSYGVNDDETWANHLAQEFPDVHIMNAGITYSAIDEILGTYRAFSGANAYIYLITHNDYEALPDIRAGQFTNPTKNYPYLVNYPSFLVHYRSEFNFRNIPSASNTTAYTHFLEKMSELTAAGDVTLLAFPERETTTVLQESGFDVHVLPPYPEDIVSFADGHLNAEGNRKLAGYIAPIFEEIVATDCSDS